MDENKTTELNQAIEDMWDSLTDEQRAAAKECKSMDELAELAGAAGVELSDEMLDAVAGGTSFYTPFDSYCIYCKKRHYMGSPLHRKSKIRLEGENEWLTVDYFLCNKTHRYFNYSWERGIYYDDSGCPVDFDLFTMEKPSTHC